MGAHRHRSRETIPRDLYRRHRPRSTECRMDRNRDERPVCLAFLSQSGTTMILCTKCGDSFSRAYFPFHRCCLAAMTEGNPLARANLIEKEVMDDYKRKEEAANFAAAIEEQAARRRERRNRREAEKRRIRRGSRAGR